MNDRLRIAIVGDYQPENVTHTATGAALDHAADQLDIPMSWEWLPTDS